MSPTLWIGVTYTNALEPVSVIGKLYSMLPPPAAPTRRTGPNVAIHSPCLMSLAAKRPFSSASNPLGRTSAAPNCNLFSQGEHSHCQWQGTAIARFWACNAQASAGVASNRRVSPAQARSHHLLAVASQTFLHGQAAVLIPSTFNAQKGWNFFSQSVQIMRAAVLLAHCFP